MASCAGPPLHAAQGPPQSTPVSPWFWIASEQVGVGSRGASKAPGKLGDWLSKPFRTSSKMMNKSAEGGRKGRGKLPL